MATKLSDIMHSIIKIDLKKLISEAAEEMNKNKRGSIIVTKDDKPVGIFSERDILRIVAKGLTIKGTKLTKHYSKKMITANQETSLKEASNIMKKNKIRRLPCTNDEGKIIGIVTASSISKNLRYTFADKLLGI